MGDKLFVAWQDEQRRWHTIAEIVRRQSGYEFGFTRGISGLMSFPDQLFRMNRDTRYAFKDLIPLFRNRIPSRSRADYKRMTEWLNLSSFADEFEMLSYFGLIPGTDSLMIYPAPAVSEGRYRLTFFVHGIRHMHESAADWCSTAQPGERLFPLLDVQNHVDANAVALRNGQSASLIGYVPAFYAQDVKRVLAEASNVADVSFTVVRCNPDAPSQLRLLCSIDAPVRPGFVALETDDHQPIARSVQPEPYRLGLMAL